MLVIIVCLIFVSIVSVVYKGKLVGNIIFDINMKKVNIFIELFGIRGLYLIVKFICNWKNIVNYII